MLRFRGSNLSPHHQIPVDNNVVIYKTLRVLFVLHNLISSKKKKNKKKNKGRKCTAVDILVPSPVFVFVFFVFLSFPFGIKLKW